MRRVLGFLIVTSCLVWVATPAHAATPLVIGFWPQNYGQFTAIQSSAGISFPYFRTRMTAGQFDSNLVTSDAHTAANAGYSLGLNIQPKTGTGGNRIGILYTDISAQVQAQSGPYYDKLVSFANEVLALPTYGMVPNYLQFHSEAATQAAPGVPDAQPYSGTASEYRQCYALIHQLFQSMGVTNKIYWQIVLGRGTYAGNGGQNAADWFPTDTSTFDLVGVDGYYRSSGNWLSPSANFQAAFTMAQGMGKQVWIDEVGADEGGPNPQSATAKATWFAGLDTYLQANRASLAGIVFTHSNDGGNWFLDSKFSGGGRTVPNYTGTSWNAWKALVTDLASPVRTLSVSTNGPGVGSVTSSPGGINCGTTCSASVPDGTSMVLKATPSGTSTFAGWGGVCSGMGTCSVTMDAAKSVTATFTLVQHALTITRLGAGAGSVTSAPGGINCGATCTANFDHGSSVVLTAAPNGGSTFTGWGGACSGSGTCTVAMDDVRSVSATFDAVLHTLTVTKIGPGSGAVMGSAGIDCGSTCSADFPEGASVTLSSAPTGGSVFGGWSGGGCAGTTDCTVMIDAAKSVSAQFDLAQQVLSVTTSGNGNGSVSSAPAGISCGTTCTANYAQGTPVVLTAAVGANSVFTGWGGACTGTGTCSLTMDAAKNVTATFTLIQRSLTVTTSGNGNGSVSSAPAGINCGSTCTANYDHGTSVVLHAVADATSTFSGWSGGGCSGTTDCTVTMDAATSVSATFDLSQRLLTVTTSGNGAGSVTSAPAGINCPGACGLTYAQGTPVVLTAAVGANSVFTGWGGACSGSATTCSLTMDAAKNVTATFTLIQRSLTVTTAGTGTGTVTSAPAGTSCGATCTAYDHGTSVVLTAAATAGSVFIGWGGACSGTGTTCSLTMDANTSVSAQFDLAQQVLSVTTSGNGNGSVSSAPAGISCGTTCTANYAQGTPVVLTAAVGANSVFTGWGGACSGSATTCSLTMDAAKNVTATFTLIQRSLTVTTAGTGTGTVTSAPAGINCGSTCTANYDHGTSVVLHAVADATSTFSGWSGGGCAGTTDCTVTMDAATSVSATFDLSQRLLTVTVNGNGNGSVTSAPAGINCPGACGLTYAQGTSVVLTAAVGANSVFTGWSGACTGTGTCSLTMDAAKNVTATFTLIQRSLTVTTTGTGTGTVTSAPAGTSCGATCTAYDHGTSVVLTAAATAGSVFIGWGGACSGTGTTCSLTMDANTSVSAQFDLAQQVLSVTTSGNGNGSVSSAPAGISCGTTCTANYAQGTPVVLTAGVGANSVFTGWGGACSGSATTCSLTMDAAKNVTATFTLIQRSLTVTTAGTGTGTVTSAPAGTSCGATCTAYDHGTSVVLTAAATAGSVFIGWGGACSGTGTTCSLTMDANTSVSAQFDLAQQVLSVTTSGNGNGSVSSAPAGISCGTTCTANYAQGTPVVLTAAVGANSVFTGWGGACSGSATTCSLTMDAAKNVTATFTLIQRSLTVTTAGTGTGTVTSAPAGINCGSTCTANYDHGTSVVLHAVADATSTFSGWSGGGCAGTTDCTVTMDAATSVSATFDLSQRLLTVTVNGNGNGSVTSAPAGINCPGACGLTYAQGTSVVLTAAVGANSVFTGWSGACTGTGTCSLTMDAAKNVTATFTLIQRSLTVTTTGTGTGTVTSAPAGTSCGATCTAYDHGTSVVLTAAATAGSVFIGWGGACSGTGTTCSLTMDANTSVSAQFDLAQQVLSVTTSGNGNGSVSSAPAGISCGTTCTANYAQGTPVVLTAGVGANSVFTGWSGACTGTGTCSLTMDAAKNVTATFTLIQRSLTVTKAGTGTGTVTSAPAGINCGSTCTANYDHGTSVVLTATPAVGSTFLGWGGACSGTGTCTVVMDAAKSVTATFITLQQVLTVTKAGAGAGTISSAPSGISCPGSCTANYAQGTSVVLTAGVGANSVFTGWGGACTGTGTCSLTMDAAKNVTATFTLIQRTLTVTKAGTGTGTVTSSPAGINCGSTCTANYDHGTSVVLTATPAVGSTFLGWGGACSGTGTCSLTMSAAIAATATFNQATTTTLGDNAPAVSYNGWFDVVDAAANGGHYRMSNVKNDTITWKSPATTSITWVTRTGPDQGKASVTIDGTNKGTVDLYTAAAAPLNKVYSALGNKVHTIVIKVLGTKNAASSGLNVRFDAFVVGATTTQESNANVLYDDWDSAAQALASDATYHSATTATSTVTIAFNGTSIDWITRRGKANGKASVRIDGVAKGTVDLYQNAAAVWQSLVSYTGLTSGSHTMVIQVLGTKNASATSTAVVVDGFIVHGP